MDATFEAYVGLYRVGLINNDLLPLPSYDEEAARAYVGLYRVGLINNDLLPLPSYDEEAARAYAEVAKIPM